MGTRTQLDEQAAWTAVLARDARQDGQFVYAVTTTGVYCRPSCPSRRPRRENVAFFGDVDAAERAGYRGCLRCTPRERQAPGLAAVERARAYLDAHLDDRVTLQALAGATGLSLFHTQRRFKQVVGLTPKEYVAARRAERFKTGLKQGRSVTDATYEAGYGSSSRVYESSNATLGMTPSAYKRGGLGVDMRYATTPSLFGRLLVAVTARGISAVLLGEDDAALERMLAEEYPRARRERAVRELEQTVRDVLARVEGVTAAPAAGPAVRPALGGSPSNGRATADRVGAAPARSARTDAEALAAPVGESANGVTAGGMAAGGGAFALDLQASDFTWRVWRELQTIPYGETRTYGDVARAIGAPRAARAVARACATNPAALVIPCHRVVGSSGALTGYRWGLDRKRRILDHERHQVISGTGSGTGTSTGAGASARAGTADVADGREATRYTRNSRGQKAASAAHAKRAEAR